MLAIDRFTFQLRGGNAAGRVDVGRARGLGAGRCCRGTPGQNAANWPITSPRAYLFFILYLFFPRGANSFVYFPEVRLMRSTVNSLHDARVGCF